MVHTQTIGQAIWVALVLAAGVAEAPPVEQAWEQKSFECLRPARGCYIKRCCELSLTVYTRDVSGSDVREVKAIGEMDSTPARVFEVLTDYAHYTEFMPYTVGSKLIERQGDEVVVWGMVNPPVISRRDWVARSRLERNGPGGVYRTTWWPEEKLGPAPMPGVVRLHVNSGSWTLVPIDLGKRTLATYQTATDPGGALPSFIVKGVSTNGLPELFESIRHRAAGPDPQNLLR